MRAAEAGAHAAAVAPLLRVSGLAKHFPVRSGLLRKTIATAKAVDGVDLTVLPGQTLGLVGESGCGKSTLARTVLRLIEPTAGSIEFEGRDITHGSMKPYRPGMQMIFQDPFSSLNPRLTIGEIVGEALRVHKIGADGREREANVKDTLRRVGLRPDYVNRYPHEFSGGQRQRIGIARALALRPKLVIADEPVSALDVSVQSQVLNLLADLKQQYGLSFIFIAHNLAVVSHISETVAVMYLGKIVERARTEDLYRNPRHPYTQMLLEAILPIAPRQTKRQRRVTGDVPSPLNPPSGCRFRTRCLLARAKGTVEGICAELEPPLEEKKNSGSDHWVACHFA